MNEIKLLNSLLPVNEARIWTPVPGCEDRYVVSDDGYVGSLSRDVSCGGGRVRRIRTRVLKPIVRKKGGRVWSVCVHLFPEEGQSLSTNVGRIVLMAFRGERPGMVASFKDGDPSNNRLENLHWTTFAAIGEAALNGGYGEDLRTKAVPARWGAKVAPHRQGGSQ